MRSKTPGSFKALARKEPRFQRAEEGLRGSQGAVAMTWGAQTGEHEP